MKHGYAEIGIIPTTFNGIECVLPGQHLGSCGH